MLITFVLFRLSAVLFCEEPEASEISSADSPLRLILFLVENTLRSMTLALSHRTQRLNGLKLETDVYIAEQVTSDPVNSHLIKLSCCYRAWYFGTERRRQGGVTEVLANLASYEKK